MTDLVTTEGYIPFDAGVEQSCHTYWKKITGAGSSTAPVLVIVAGGPLFGHPYMLPFQELAQRSDGPSSIVLYDQLGCGRSSKIPAKKHDSSFWTLELLRRELANLIRHLNEIAPEADGQYDLLGHSIGATLASLLAADPPGGLRRLVLSNAVASVALLNKSNLRVLENYPASVRDSIVEWEEHILGRRSECHVSEDVYQQALGTYRKDHALRMDGPLPEEIILSLQCVNGARDAFRGLAGADVEMIFGGSLAEVDARPVLPNIAVPTLVLNGEFDKATLETSEPFCQLIPTTTRVIMSGTAHFPHYEDRDRYLGIVAQFLYS